MTTKQFHELIEKHKYKFVRWRGIADAIVEKDGKTFIASEDFPNLTDNPDSILIYNIMKDSSRGYHPKGNPVVILVN